MPPVGCTCIEGWNPNFGTTGPVCKDYDDSGYPWCYVADESSCSKKPSAHQGWWVICEAKGAQKVV